MNDVNDTEEVPEHTVVSEDAPNAWPEFTVNEDGFIKQNLPGEKCVISGFYSKGKRHGYFAKTATLTGELQVNSNLVDRK